MDQLNNRRERIFYLAFIIIATMMAIWPALYNNFPLATPDSGAYVHNGIKLSLPIDRPITYSIFILLTSWDISLWPVIVIQGLIFVLMLQSVCARFLPQRATYPIVLAINAVVAFGTQAAWFTAQLMPDIFTSLFLLSIIIYFSEDDNNKKKNRKWLFLIAAFMLMHYSNILIGILLSGVLFAYFKFMKVRQYLPKLRNLLLTATCGYILISSVNLIAGRGFTISPASSVFMMARMAENGVLDEYLAEKCPTEHYELCNFQGHLGDRQWAFMWMGDYPHRTKGWLDPDVQHEYKKIVRGILTTPKFLGLQLLSSLNATFRQSAQLYVGDGLMPLGTESTVYRSIDELFPHQIKEYRTALQAQGQLPTMPSNIIILVASAAMIIWFLFFLGKTENKNLTGTLPQPDWLSVFAIVLLFLFVNAFITGTFSTVIARLQARVFWVLPFMCFLYCLSKIMTAKQDKNEARALL